MVKIESVIVDREPAISSYLKKTLAMKFPEITVRGMACNSCEAHHLIESSNPDLVFYDINVLNKEAQSPQEGLGYEIVVVSDRSEDAIRAIRQNACGFLLKPLDVSGIVLSVGSVVRRLAERTSVREPMSGGNIVLPHTKLIGVPTMEGIDFLYAHEIVRCEGLQKATRVVSTRKSNMISAYNIGEFKKLLDEFGFFSCHKSHLINLMHVRKYTREGFVYLSDNTAIPLARRRRLDFLDQLRHL